MSTITAKDIGTSNWFGNTYRLLHMDAHHGSFKEIYRDFDAEGTAQVLKEIGCQMVSFMAHDGPCYYPSKIGQPHPGLNRDFVGEFTKALQTRGMKALVYVGAGSGICKSPEVDTVLIPMYREILESYDVDGFFVDGAFQPYLGAFCDCDYCRERFAREVGGELPENDDAPNAFAYRRWQNRHMDEFMDRVYRAMAAIKPGVVILNNHVWVTRHPVTPPPYVSHICWDTPVPLQGCYAWNFSFEARYLATLTDVLPEITWSCMNVSSHDWVDYELRETEAFMQECAIMLAGCGRTYLSFNPYPSGNPAPALMEAFGEVNRRTQEVEPFVEGCRPVKDVAVLLSADSVWSKAPIVPHAGWTPSPAYHSVAGAHKALTEGHVQMLMPNSEVFEKTIHEYLAVVLADQPILNEAEVEAIRRFVHDGGALLATCATGTRDTENAPLDDFALADVLGVRCLEPSGTENSYLRTTRKDEEYGIPAYDIPVVGPYMRIETTTAETRVELVPPYEGIKSGTAPPAESPEGPGVTINSYGQGKAIYCGANLFSAYYQQDTPVLRKLALWMLGLVHPAASRTLVLENAPITVEVFYNQRGDERLVHLINYSGDKREVGVPQTQDFVVVHGIRVRVRMAGEPARITRVPSGDAVAFTYRDGWVSFDAEPLEIHEVYRIEACWKERS